MLLIVPILAIGMIACSRNEPATSLTAEPAAAVATESPVDETETEDATTAEELDAASEGSLFAIPGEEVFPEGVSYDAATGNFYVGSTTDGTLYMGNIDGEGEMTIFSAGGADGRTAAIGTKVDDDGLLWVAGGGTGQLFVYDTATGDHVATFTTPAAEATFINDLAITESGVYFTDSFRPILWRASGTEGGEAEAWLDFTGTVLTYAEGFNLNGIVPTAEGSDLIVIHSGEGALYQINIATQTVTAIDMGDAELTAGDGIALVGETLYVTRNSFGEIVPVLLAEDLRTGSAGTAITSDLFIYPTTIAYTGSGFLVANSQFNNRGGSPELPFTIAEIPLSSAPDAATSTTSAADVASVTTFQLDAWADNWFALYLGEDLLIEDSVSINTERSFNAETVTFEASYPLALNFILKDFKENDTGLEYIGERNQQMGDGGFIMQLIDTGTGAVVAVSDESVACTVIHTAPLDKSCESEPNPVAGTAPCTFEDLGEPEGWKAADYDDSAWTATTIHSAAAVSPKQGYDDISWDSSAQFIWGPDLETDNTLLCRVTVAGQ